METEKRKFPISEWGGFLIGGFGAFALLVGGVDTVITWLYHNKFAWQLPIMAIICMFMGFWIVTQHATTNPAND